MSLLWNFKLPIQHDYVKNKSDWIKEINIHGDYWSDWVSKKGNLVVDWRNSLGNGLVLEHK